MKLRFSRQLQPSRGNSVRRRCRRRRSSELMDADDIFYRDDWLEGRGCSSGGV